MNDNRYTPLDMVGVGFDWDALGDRLDQDMRESREDPRLADVAARLLQLLLPDTRREVRLDKVALRVVALAWVVSPGYFAGSPSLRKLAIRCGVSRTELSAITSEMSRLLGWRNRAQQRAWNWRDSGHDALGEGQVADSTPPRTAASAGEELPGARGK